MKKLVFLFFIIICSSGFTQEIIPIDGPRTYKNRVNYTFATLHEKGLSTEDVLSWVFEFSAEDSLLLHSVLLAITQAEKSVTFNTIYKATENDNTPSKKLEGLFIGEIGDKTYYTQEELLKYLKRLRKSFKKTPIELVGIGFEYFESDISEILPSKKLIESESLYQFRGIVKSGNTSMPISYVNIGVEGENIGTVSNEVGFFELSMTDKQYKLTDSITFSHVGFSILKKPLNELIENSNLTIYLEENALQLKEVEVVSLNKAKKVTLGTKRTTNQFGFVLGKGAGAEAARKFESNKGPLFLNSTSIFVWNKSGEPFNLLVNIYDTDPETGLPKNNLIRKPLLVTSSIEKGWLEVNLNSQNLVVEKPFFISFQWVNDNVQNPSMGITRKKAFTRAISLGNWTETKDFGWIIKVEASILDN